MNDAMKSPHILVSSVNNPRYLRRLKWIFAIGFVLALIAGGYIEFYLRRPMGGGPAGPTVDQLSFQTPWTEKEVLLLGFGDSIAAGLGADPPHQLLSRIERNPVDEFDDMKEISLSKVIPNLSSFNAAVSGSTSIEHLQWIDSKIAVQSEGLFGIIVLTTGGNDLIHNYGYTPPREGAMYGATLAQAKPWIENFEDRFDQILDRITAKFPGGCAIFVANIYDPTDGDGDAENAGLPAWPGGLEVHGAYNKVIEKVVATRSNVHLVDMHQLFLGHGIHCRKFWRRHYDASDPHYWYFTNLEDPNDRGFDALRRAYLIEMAKVLPNRFELTSSSP
jgi:lysophospholipase L1-like esterase